MEKLKADAESKSAVYKNGVDNWNAKEKVKIAKRERERLKLARSNYVGGHRMEYHDRTFGPEEQQCGTYVLHGEGRTLNKERFLFDFMKFWAMKMKSLLENLKI